MTTLAGSSSGAPAPTTAGSADKATGGAGSTGGTANASWLARYTDAVMNTFGTPSRVLVRGQGAQVWDADGKEYTDLLAGIAVNCLGHAHPAIVEAVTDQLGTLGHVSNFFTTPAQVRLAEELISLTFPGQNAGDSRVFLANSGTEANEAAFKIARRHGGSNRPRVLALQDAFHGRTMGALALTHRERIRPRITQRTTARAKMRAYAERGAHPGQKPMSGVFAATNTAAAPALDADGEAVEESVPRVLRVCG